MFGLQLILILLLMGGLLAYLGDRLGRTLGRRHVTLFGLRPRNTATLISVFSGILTVSLTLVALLAISEDARIALFGLETLKKNIVKTETARQRYAQRAHAASTSLEHLQKKYKKNSQELSTSITSLESEQAKQIQNIHFLKKVVHTLEGTVKRTKTESLQFEVGDILVTRIVNPPPSVAAARLELKDTLKIAETILQPKSSNRSPKRLAMSDAALTKAVTTLSKNTGQTILRLIVASNIVLGETIPLRFELVPNLLVFKAGEEITSTLIQGDQKQAEIEMALKELLQKSNQVAKGRGMLPGADGLIGQIPYAALFETASHIDAKSGLVKTSVYAQKNTYTAGPLFVTLRTSP